MERLRRGRVTRRGRRGKSTVPDGGRPPGLTPDSAPDLVEGARAAERFAQQARSTVPRRALQHRPGFAEMCPEVGELDAAAVERALDDDPDSALDLLATLTRATDRGVAEAARRLAGTVVWRLADRDRQRSPGIGRMESRRDLRNPGDLDLERSTEPLVESVATGTALDVERLWTRQWRRPAAAWCLLLDTSGSMHGDALATAALTTAAFLLRAHADHGRGDQVVVLSFADDVLALAQPTDRLEPDAVLQRVLGLQGSGRTDLAAALRHGADQLAALPAQRRVTLLLSDCRATRPEGVVEAAALHPELRVLAPGADPAAAYDLGRAVGARVEPVGGPTDVPDAVARLLR